MLAIADEQTIKDLDKYKEMLARLGDPRKITEEEARELMHTAKPIYWINSGIHSPETGGPEMLIELAYRLIIEETPFIQQIRNNVITFITPVLEVDGREREVDTFYYGKETGKQAAAADVLGQVRAARRQPRWHGPVSRHDQGIHQGHDRVASHRASTICTNPSPIYMSPPAPAPITCRSTPSPSTNGGCSAKPN